jgi:putative Mn2+ efflux pump MntP
VGAALSIDNIAIGFALGSYHVNVLVAALTIGLVSVILTVVGLDLGERLGERLGEQAELVGGAILILIGLLIAPECFERERLIAGVRGP